MKNKLYPKLAWNGISKNKKLYLPYLLTCIGMVMMFYIISFLASSQTLSAMRGGDIVMEMLSLGQYVIGIFALIFLFYTNSFLIRRRKKEFGLFNILGMGKGNLARIMFFECLFIFVVSIIAGLFCGILFSKIAELFMIHVLSLKVDFGFQISTASIRSALIWFAIIFLLLFLHCLRQIRTANPIELLHSENAGEKPPKANWFLGILGIVILGAAYYLAITIQDPLKAMVLFFVAVIMVIIATYILFVAGSVVLCRLLQKKKNYYYKTRHFVAVSSMIYRMKRNGAGLASICILATMILVMISSTVCLYIGEEDIIQARYPRDILVDIRNDDADLIDGAAAAVDEVLLRYQVMPSEAQKYSLQVISGVFNKENVFSIGNTANFSNMQELLFISLEDYNQLADARETLEPDEILIYSERNSWHPDTITINGNLLRVKKEVKEFVKCGDFSAEIIPVIYVVIPDWGQAKILLGDFYDISYTHHYYAFNLSCGDEMQREIRNEISQGIRGAYEAWRNLSEENASAKGSFTCQGIAEDRWSFYALYGGLFFLGILLGIVFLFATVLIMYYKQISEGYEDQSRFEIMQKVGMTKTEIRQSINSQILTIFFLPLLFAGIHLGFAFPIISKALLLFGVTNTVLLAGVTIVCFLIFALFYIAVYWITSKAYYNLVSSRQEGF